MEEHKDPKKADSMEYLLQEIGLSESEVQSLLKMDRRKMTEELVSRYHQKLTGKPLASLLKALKLYGEPELFAEFLCEIINGPPVAGQLIALRIADKPEWRRFEKVDTALKLYQADFDGLAEAFSNYQDHFLCGCAKRSCLPRI